MKPFYEQDGVTIYHGDCRDVLPLVSAGACIFDPPYGIGLRNGDVDGHRSDRWDRITGDESNAIGLLVLELARAREMTIAAFASPWKPWPGRWRNQIVWDKGGAVGGGGDIATCLKRSWELIQVWNPRPFKGSRDESVWHFPITPQDTRDHIAAKPIELMKRLIWTFVSHGDVILDPCMGTGPTLVAAKQIGHRAIGIELEEKYCEIAAKRLQQGALPLEMGA